MDAKNNWNKVTNNETFRKKFTNFILFTPAVHKIISSLSFSNLIIARTKEIKKDSGINLVKIFGTFNNE